MQKMRSSTCAVDVLTVTFFYQGSVPAHRGRQTVECEAHNFVGLDLWHPVSSDHSPVKYLILLLLLLVVVVVLLFYPR